MLFGVFLYNFTSPNEHRAPKKQEDATLKKDIERLTTRWCSTGLVVSSDVIIYTDLNTTNDKRITLKWSLDRSSAANEVRAFGNMFLCTFFGLILVETY